MMPLTAKILVIDDDQKLRDEITEYFEDNGFSIVQAEDGEKGLELIKTERPILVITDLQMPGISGLDVLRTLTKEYPELPVVVISEEGGLDDVIQALRIGAWDYLTKPISQMPVLEHGVCRALERSRLIEQNRIYAEKIEEANQALKKSLDVLEEDQEAGRSVQMRLLPSKGVEFGDYHFDHSVSPSLYLSGDFVDYFSINEDVFGFYLADVSGHGASSAFVTVLLKSLVSKVLGRYQVQQDQTIVEPEKLLAELGEEIYLAKLGKYLTMVYGVVDLKNNTLTYSIGGHYPNPVLLEGDTARFLEGQGFPVGIMEKATYQRHSIPLGVDMKLMIFSDGIAEILPEPDMDGKEKTLMSMIKEGKASIQYFIDTFGLENKKDLPDDVTILTLWRKPS